MNVGRIIYGPRHKPDYTTNLGRSMVYEAPPILGQAIKDIEHWAEPLEIAGETEARDIVLAAVRALEELSDRA